jgi:hypothetical protein
VADVSALPTHRELTWTFADGPFGALDVLVSVPERPAGDDRRFPVLVAFHGRGESRKGRRAGARAWVDDYGLERALGRLHQPPLTAGDFEGFVTSERLCAINLELARQPYRGLILVCPYLPDVLKGAEAFRQAEPLARFVVDVLLPRVREKTPAQPQAAATGVDGVSLGGRAALLVGLTRPRAFGSVGALQAAIDERELSRFAQLAARARLDNPDLSLRLLTSDEDYFLQVNRDLSRALSRAGVAHRLETVVGTHSYRFNRGAGVFEMLLLHDRSLRDASTR